MLFATEDDGHEAGYLANSATLSIKSWICHLLRSVDQDQARSDIIDTLNPEAVLIVNDWAMKVLPQRYRESNQTGSASVAYTGTCPLCTDG